MSESKSPLTRSIGLSGVLRWALAVFSVIAIGDAFHEGHYGLAIGGTVVVVLAVFLGFKGWRARQALDDAGRNPDAPL